ncbi:MAG: hypothetical protein LUC16_01980, partial [Coprobacillus sp.]|nr:hypothetical protein [Coprobacillus sp.]
ISNREAGDASVQANLDLEISNREAADTTLQSNLDTETSERKSADDTLTTNLTTETSERKSADEDLQSQIDTETKARETLSSDLTEKISEEASAREAADATLQGSIDEEESARITADNSLQSSLNTEITNRETADNTLQVNITSEETARKTADTNLQTAIDDLADELESDYSTTEEVEKMISQGIDGLATETYVDNKVKSEADERSSADTTLQNNITAEETARADADTTLQTNITAEEAARTDADTTLQSNITAEETAREKADEDLQADINTKVDGISLVFDDNYDLTLSYTINGATTKLDSINLPLQTLIVDGYQDEDEDSETYGDVILELFNGEFIIIKWDAFVEGLVNKDTFDSTVADLQGQITTVSSDLSTLSGTVSTLSSNLSSLSGTVSSHTTSIGNLESSVSSIEGKLNNYALDSDVAHLAKAETITGAWTFEETITGSISGNAGTATRLKEERLITIFLDDDGSGAFDGSGDVNCGVTGILPVASGGTGQTDLDDVTVGSAKVANSTKGTLQVYESHLDSNNSSESTLMWEFDGTEDVEVTINLAVLEDDIASIISDLTNNYYDKNDITGLLSGYQVSGNYAKTDASNTFSGSGTNFSQTLSGDDPRWIFKDTNSGKNQGFVGFSSSHYFGIGDNVSDTVKWLIYAKEGDFYSSDSTQPIPRVNWQKTGDADQPIYFGSDGIPVACDYTLGNMCSKSITTPSAEAYVKITASGTLTSVTSVASEANSSAAGFMTPTHYNTLEDWRNPYWAEVGGTTITGYDKTYSWSTGTDFAYQVSIPYSEHGKGGNISKSAHIPSVRCYEVTSSSKISAIDCDYDIDPTTGDITIYADTNLNLLVIIV